MLYLIIFGNFLLIIYIKAPDFVFDKKVVALLRCFCNNHIQTNPEFY